MIKKIMKILCVMCVVVSSFASIDLTRVAAENTEQTTEKKGRASSNVITIPAGTTRAGMSITKDTTLIFEGNATLTSSISVDSNVSLYIEIKNNGVVNVTGSNARFVDYDDSEFAEVAFAASPGIYVPATSRLYVYGKGTLNAKGGNGTAKTGGNNGSGATAFKSGDYITALGHDAPDTYNSTDLQTHSVELHSKEYNMVAGASAKGGYGGCAPAPGIGGYGGGGGIPGRYALDYNNIGEDYLNIYEYGPINRGDDTGPNGYEGIAGWCPDRWWAGDNYSVHSGRATGGESAGNVYAHGEVTINATAGTLVTSDDNNMRPGGGKDYQESKIKVSGGGAGGNGGEAYGSPGIGGGGGGGGGAGSTPGAGGHAGADWDAGWAVGNVGGETAGGTGGDNSFSTGTYHRGGNGGNGGNAGSNGKGGKIYTDPIAKVIMNDSLTAAGGGGKSLVGSTTVNFIDDFNVTLSQKTYTYDGSAKTPDVLIKRKSDNSDCTSVKGTNYSVEYKDNTDAGTATVTISSLGNIDLSDNYLELGSTGTITLTFTIQKANNPVTVSTDYDTLKTIVYGGQIQATLLSRHVKNTGAVTWSLHSDSTAQARFVKTNDDSYKVIPTKIGKLKLSVSIASSKNFNASSALSVEIDVTAYDIENGTEVSIPNPGEQKYKGINIEPEHGKDGLADITYANNKDSDHTTLIKGTDFTYEYGTNNLNANTIGNMTVKAQGNYTGEVELTFPIIPRPIEETTITVDDIMYTGLEAKPEPVVKIGSTIIPYLTTNGDFTLLWKAKDGGTDLITVGDKTIEVTGTGNISGTKEVGYKVTPANIADVIEKEAAKNVYFDGDNKKQESRPKYTYLDADLTEKDSGLGTVNDPDDYELIFTNNEHAGTATVTVNGINNFVGSSRTYTYEIMQRPLYIIPDKNQWKYLGTVDTFGSEQTQEHPTYKQYIKKLSADGSKETNENDGEFVVGHEPSLEGYLTRELGETLGNYKYTIGSLQLRDDTTDVNINRDYKVSLVDTTNYFTIKELDPTGLKTTLDGVEGKDEWYKNEKVKVEAPDGYTISRSKRRGCGQKLGH